MVPPSTPTDSFRSDRDEPSVLGVIPVWTDARAPQRPVSRPPHQCEGAGRRGLRGRSGADGGRGLSPLRNVCILSSKTVAPNSTGSRHHMPFS